MRNSHFLINVQKCKKSTWLLIAIIGRLKSIVKLSLRWILCNMYSYRNVYFCVVYTICLWFLWISLDLLILHYWITYLRFIESTWKRQFCSSNFQKKKTWKKYDCKIPRIQASLSHHKMILWEKFNLDLLFMHICTVDILFLSNHNIYKSLWGPCFWASDPLIERLY